MPTRVQKLSLEMPVVSSLSSAIVEELDRNVKALTRAMNEAMFFPPEIDPEASSEISDAIDALRYAIASESKLDASVVCPNFMQMLKDA